MKKNINYVVTPLFCDMETTHVWFEDMKIFADREAANEYTLRLVNHAERYVPFTCHKEKEQRDIRLEEGRAYVSWLDQGGCGFTVRFDEKEVN